MEISQDIKQYLVEIDLRLMNQEGEIFFEDVFQWDILNQLNKYKICYVQCGRVLSEFDVRLRNTS